jgi:formimidoylglutamate deiminase
MNKTLLWTPLAWIDQGWRERVLIEIRKDQCFGQITAGTSCPTEARKLPGPVIPSLVNGHSHAFQRGFAAMTEQRSQGKDDFWRWRERMYLLADAITPSRLRVIATQLYAELLEGGYTQVCEFHYLHRFRDDQNAEFGLAMSEALIQAAEDTGIGLTLLPALYERADFWDAPLSPVQRRFSSTPQQLLVLREALGALSHPRLRIGVAIHSLRAVGSCSIQTLCSALKGDPAPIHIHIAEQPAEVRACFAATGLRPVAWLARHVEPDARWSLIHATHTVPEEVHAVAQSGASLVVCPTTEANLGDGTVDWPAWNASGVALAVGSDSQVTRQWPAELRLLEYGQRLKLHRRNVAATSKHGIESTAQALFEDALGAGAQAAGLAMWGLREGARADLVVLDPGDPGFLGLPVAHYLDAVIFSCDRAPFAEVWVGGERLVVGGRHRNAESIAAAYHEEMLEDQGSVKYADRYAERRVERGA